MIVEHRKERKGDDELDEDSRTRLERLQRLQDTIVEEEREMLRLGERPLMLAFLWRGRGGAR